MKRYPAILSSIYNTPHCVLPGKLEEIIAFVDAVQGGYTPPAQAAYVAPEAYCLAADGEQAAMDRVNATAAGEAFVAVVPLFGLMAQHMSLEMEYCGGVACDPFGRMFERLLMNSSVKTIILEVHSPGGQVFGTGELADLIYHARGKFDTRIVTAVNSMAASGALWVSTAADEVYVTPGGTMGSLGVMTAHCDISKAEEMRGEKTTLIATPAKKIAGNEFEPLSDEHAAELLARAEKTLARFAGAVARNRGVSEEHARSEFGAGGMLRADECVAAGLADGVMTFREVVAAEVDRLRTTAPANGSGGNARANARAIALAESEL